MDTKRVYAIHEHNLKASADRSAYEAAIGRAIQELRIPGLLHGRHLKAFKEKREGEYTVLWVFENKEAIEQNFGTPENPKWPEAWLWYENELLAPYIEEHPDKISFTDYEELSSRLLIIRAARSPDSEAASIVPGTSSRIDACSPAK